MSNTPYAMRGQRTAAFIAFFLLFLGIGRMFSLATHDPVLGYANSYDMIRLQACHQIWPADKAINITDGTPAAPLRRYTQDKHVETTCFPSSELLFTEVAIELANIKNKITNEKLVSIKTIGFVKALSLALTVLIMSIYFYRRAHYQALLVNGLLMLFVLSDPGITLYLNTFYTEFSAVYFLYLTMAGLVVLAGNNWRIAWSLPFLAGLIGLGFAKPQHMPLVFSIAILISVYLLFQRHNKTAALIMLCGIFPILLQASGKFSPRNENMVLANKVNVTATLLESSENPGTLLKNLSLPESCIALNGKNWYYPEIQSQKICHELSGISHFNIISASLKSPELIVKLASSSIPKLKQWIFNFYGQVESQKNGAIENYTFTIGSILTRMPKAIFIMFWLMPILVMILIGIYEMVKTRSFTNLTLYMTVLVIIQWIAFSIALFGDGVTDLAKHAHLAILTVLVWYTIGIFLMLDKTANCKLK